MFAPAVCVAALVAAPGAELIVDPGGALLVAPGDPGGVAGIVPVPGGLAGTVVPPGGGAGRLLPPGGGAAVCAESQLLPANAPAIKVAAKVFFSVFIGVEGCRLISQSILRGRCRPSAPAQETGHSILASSLHRPCQARKTTSIGTP